MISIKRQLVLVNRTEWNVYVFAFMSAAFMACITVLGIFFGDYSAPATGLVAVLGLSVKYVKFRKFFSLAEDEDLSEEEERVIESSLPQKLVQKIVEKYVSSKQSSMASIPDQRNDSLELPESEKSASPKTPSSPEKSSSEEQ